MDKRKLARWSRTYRRFEPTSLIYRREHYVYRHNQRWLTRGETRELVSELCSLYGLAEPRTYITETERKQDTEFEAAFVVKEESGKCWFHFRTYPALKNRTTYVAVDRKCRQYAVYVYNVPAQTIRSGAVLHEFAHYLCFMWWGHAPHDERFAAVMEALYSWYQRKRNKRGVVLRKRMVLENGDNR